MSRSWLCGALVMFGLASSALAADPPSRAVEPARVLLVAPSDASSLVSEALVRAQGELFAVGLTSTRAGSLPVDATDATADTPGSPPRLPTDVYGLLVLEQSDHAIIIHAWAPHATTSLDATVELSAPGVTAEVLAVKAVETLRAAMLQFARRERGAVPEAVRGFTRLPDSERPKSKAPTQRPKMPRKPAPEGADEQPDDKHEARAAGTTATSAPLAAWLGPQVSIEPNAGASLGGQLGLLVGPRWGFVALAFDTSIGRLELDAAEGDAKVQRRALTLLFGGRWRPLRSWELFARAGVGYASLDVRGNGAPGYRGLHLTHETFTMQAGIGAVWWLTRSFGVYGSFGSVVALDAPNVRIAGHRIATLAQPALFVSLGATAAVF